MTLEEATGPISITLWWEMLACFLLDSKNYLGEASVEYGELKVRRLEDPDDSYACHGIVARMRAASAELRGTIEATTGVVVWVQPVVVLWARFPQRVAELSGVFFVHGEALTEWLDERRRVTRPIDKERIRQVLEDLASPAWDKLRLLRIRGLA